MRILPALVIDISVSEIVDLLVVLLVSRQWSSSCINSECCNFQTLLMSVRNSHSLAAFLLLLCESKVTKVATPQTQSFFWPYQVLHSVKSCLFHMAARTALSHLHYLVSIKSHTRHQAMCISISEVWTTAVCNYFGYLSLSLLLSTLYLMLMVSLFFNFPCCFAPFFFSLAEQAL